MLFCVYEHLSSELDLAQIFGGIGKARRFEEYIHYCGLFAFSLPGPLAEISPEKKFSFMEEDYLSDYVTVRLVRVSEVINFSSHTFYRTNLCPENYTCIN